MSHPIGDEPLIVAMSDRLLENVECLIVCYSHIFETLAACLPSTVLETLELCHLAGNIHIRDEGGFLNHL